MIDRSLDEYIRGIDKIKIKEKKISKTIPKIHKKEKIIEEIIENQKEANKIEEQINSNETYFKKEKDLDYSYENKIDKLIEEPINYNKEFKFIFILIIINIFVQTFDLFNQKVKITTKIIIILLIIISSILYKFINK